VGSVQKGQEGFLTDVPKALAELVAENRHNEATPPGVTLRRLKAKFD
jgi:hypothetical protein